MHAIDDGQREARLVEERHRLGLRVEDLGDPLARLVLGEPADVGAKDAVVLLGGGGVVPSLRRGRKLALAV
jgi:hypothetical protein